MINKRRKNTARLRAWRIMRIGKMFTMCELATLAEAGSSNIKHWLYCLEQAGYIKKVGTRKRDTGIGKQNVYRLVKNTGLEAPVQKGMNFLYDPNTKEYWAKDNSKLPEPTPKTEEIINVPTIKMKVNSLEELKQNWKRPGGTSV
ncbi:MAG: hypothetical protein HQK99_16960 [Nitrospirae bacterium]|nr:hypothetical protein [Nitrospirota bacterium]